MSARTYGILGLLTALVALTARPIYQRALVLGLLRTDSNFSNLYGMYTLKSLPNTAYCEDLHYHAGSRMLYTACEDSWQARGSWFPPLAIFDQPEAAKQGSFAVIDPETFRVRKVKVTGMKTPFVTHGIDLYEPPNDPSTLYIFAVNHLPNPAHFDAASPADASPDKARSQIEVFRHKVGASEAAHVRSIRHPLVRTPNDIFAVNASAFYVTNDHYYREGPMRGLEDVLPPSLAPWTDTIHVTFDPKVKDPDAGRAATIALTSQHNNNGLGHAGPAHPEEVLIGDASGGVLSRARPTSPTDPTLRIIEQIQLDSCMDNPSWFEDPYAALGGADHSGYIVAGLPRAAQLAGMRDKKKQPIASMVTYLRANRSSGDVHAGWRREEIFRDAGRHVRGAATAVMVAVNPATHRGRRQGRLFVTGFATNSVWVSELYL